MPLRVLWPGAASAGNASPAAAAAATDAHLPLPQPSLAELRATVAAHFRLTRAQQADMVLSDTATDLGSDEDVAALRDGTTLVLAFAGDRALAAPARERITFVPHPLTVTAAGDYEYFAAQVRAVLPSSCCRALPLIDGRRASLCSHILRDAQIDSPAHRVCCLVHRYPHTPRDATPLCMHWPSSSTTACAPRAPMRHAPAPSPSRSSSLGPTPPRHAAWCPSTTMAVA